MRIIAHSEIVRHGLLYITKEFYQSGYSSLSYVFEKFESTHELLKRYEEAAERYPRFKDECLFRYKKNKEIVIANRRYLTNQIFNDKIKSAFWNVEQNHNYDLTTVIDEIYMKIDFVLNELVDHINKSCKAYQVRRRAMGYLELENIGFSGMRFVCDINTLEGFQGYIRGKDIICKSCPRQEDDERWIFRKEKRSGRTMYML